MSEENCFYVCNGRKLNDLDDLLDELSTIDEDSFRYHVNEEKNDFASWIKEVIKDKVLANQVSKTKDKEKIISLVEKRISSPNRRKKRIISQMKEGILNE
jgi:hypothetical protein